MPFVFNSTSGEWEWEGEMPDENAAVAVAESPAPAEPAPDTRPKAPEAERNERPWYEKVFGRYSLLRPQAAIDNLKNDVQYEIKQFSNPETALPRLTNLMIQNQIRPYGTSMLPGSNDFGNTFALGGFKSSANAQKAVLDLTGQLTPEREGRIDEQLDAAYRANGFRPPSEMTDEELAGDDMRSSLVLNTALAVGTMGGSAAFQGTALAARFPWLAKSLQLLDASKGKTLVSKAGRFSLGQLADELPSTYLDDNTGGSSFQLLKMLGVDPDGLMRLIR